MTHPAHMYRKKPVCIEAHHWTPRLEGGQYLPVPPAPNDVLREISPRPGWEIHTLEGWRELRPGDWIICGVAGEWYPCRADIFVETYELADTPPTVDRVQP